MEPIHRSDVKIYERQIDLGHLLAKADKDFNLTYGDLSEVSKLTCINHKTIGTIWNHH